MVDFAIRDNISKIVDQIFEVPISDILNTWFAADITIQTSDNSRGTTIIIDFSYSVTATVFYTLDGGTTFVAFNDGQTVTGGQSRFLRVTNGNVVNFKSDQLGTVNRCIVSEV